ncbi:MAG: sugar ABC transporter substrate-binding protein [Boseongicola sp. SB0664_bin_43]|uniref:Sugar ABC transporter substrate-binding protein n=1 Tax=Boseongicola sp. SB0664_bin_43 TaxID=2604844 RepID=A0A6B0Y3Y0_9RHOB|nr:sugar ABC transporter substrate-binding protein [Boseongicola sp. SB0664_bin_43]MYK32606.1 sugar ABC transporter substrate-binding protein [Boseongicola sp. SB0670_bin_30]
MQNFAKVASGAGVVALAAGLAHAEVVSPSGGHSIDVGLDAPIVVPGDTPLKVAFFIATKANNYVVAMVDEAERIAEDLGFELEVFDAQFNAQIQMDQLENVLENGDFNAWYVTPVDSNLMCDVVTKDAAAKNIVVATSNISICGRDMNHFADQWEPGIITYVGAAETVDYIGRWMDTVVADREGVESNALLMKGFAGLTITNALEAGAERLSAADNNFNFVGQAYGDFTAADAQAKIETLLVAHPEANVILSSYSDMTVGAINALEDAGRLDDVAVYDIGAGIDSVPLIQEGAITASATFAPRTHVRQSLGAIVGVWQFGVMPPPVQDGLMLGDINNPVLIKAEDLGAYTPQY